jgi:hypothetical protein
VTTLAGVLARPVSACKPSGHFRLTELFHRDYGAVLALPEEREIAGVYPMKKLEQRLIHDLRDQFEDGILRRLPIEHGPPSLPAWADNRTTSELVARGDRLISHARHEEASEPLKFQVFIHASGSTRTGPPALAS